MLRKHVASTALAPFAVAHRGLVVGTDVIGTLGDLYGRRLPETERVDGARRPVATRLAMTVPHGDRFATHREFDRTAKAATLVITHGAPPNLAEGRMFRARRSRVNRQRPEARHRGNVRRRGHREPSCGRPVAQPRM